MIDPTTKLPVGKLPTGLLASLLTTFGAEDPAVLVGAGVGQDAAAITFGDRILVAKTDPITFAGERAATYLIDVNANDLACLGATPRWLLVTALLPEGIAVGQVSALFTELAVVSRQRGIAVIGGHTEVTAGLDRTMLIGLMLGDATPERFLPPGGAAPGDVLLLTKAVAIEGSALLAHELAGMLVPQIEPEIITAAQGLLAAPGLSIVPDAAALRAVPGVTALHDVTEGGVAMAVREIAAGSGVGAELDRGAVPVLPATVALARALALDPLGMLGSGSLLATARPDAVSGLLASATAAGVEVTPVGRLLGPGDDCWLVDNGQRQALPRFDTDEVSRALARFRQHGEQLE